MNFSFDIKITEKDMYRFQLRQAYTGMQGWLAIALAVVMFVIAGATLETSEPFYTAIYVGAAIFFLLHIPITLRLRAKTAIKTNPVFAEALHYTFSEEGIKVVQGEEEALLTWDLVYKIVGTKEQVLVFSNRISAFILPRTQITEYYEQIKELSTKKLEKYRVKFCKEK